MALKDLLVCVDQTENSVVRLRLAVDLAIRNDSRLTAIFVRELNRAEASMEAVAERSRSTLEALTRGHNLVAEMQCVDGVASVVVPQHARYADLCILGQDRPEGPSSVDYTFAEQLLFVTGRPVLFVPPVGSLETLGRHIVVAWNSSRPAARSVNDALPLIEQAERTTVLMFNPSATIDRHGGCRESALSRISGGTGPRLTRSY
jgi:hypothetical protein